MKDVMKAYKGFPMEGVIATWYAKVMRKDLQRYKRIAAQMAKNHGGGVETSHHEDHVWKGTFRNHFQWIA